ncbi:hypothetical protein D9M72_420770 [compost metagenome]
MDVGEEVPVQVVPGRVGVTCVRPRSGNHHSKHHCDAGKERDGGHHRPGGSGKGRKCDGGEPSRTPVGPVDQQRRDNNEGHRDQEVETHDPRVELGEHRDAADDRLGRDACQQAQCQQEEVPALFAEVPQIHQHEHRNRRQRERQEPVAEFDETVDAHFRSVDQGRISTARPGGAAQPGRSEADRAAGHHEHRLSDE